jgi:hypothetical protein
MAVKKAKQVGGKTNYHRARAKGRSKWMKPGFFQAPSLDDVFGPRSVKLTMRHESINVEYVLRFGSNRFRDPQFADANLYPLLRIVVDFSTLRQLQKTFGKRSWGELTPDLVLRNPKTRRERGRLHRAHFIDAGKIRQGRFGPGLYEIDLLGASWRPVPGFAFDNPIPVLKMWKDRGTK